MLVTAAGRAIRFQEQDVRPMGLPAGGVMGIKLQNRQDRVIGLVIVRPRSDLLVVADDGQAKRTPLSAYPTQSRYGQGVITARFTTPDVHLAGACVLQSRDPAVLVTKNGAAKTIRGQKAPRMGRATRGQAVIALQGKDIIVDAFAPLLQPDAERNK